MIVLLKVFYGLSSPLIALSSPLLQPDAKLRVF
jgi:hypothetical protein